MPEPLYVLISFAYYFVGMLLLTMSIRAIFSWFFEPEGKLFHFLFVLTEPAILPLRKLFAKLNLFQGIPIDAAYAGTLLALLLIQTFLSSYLV